MESVSGAEEAPDGPPARFLALFFPNGVYPSAWVVNEDDDGLSFGETLTPLSKFIDQSITFTGINHPLGGHLGQTAGFLSGVDFGPNEKGIVTGATSLDQMLAQRWKDETFLPSLHLALEPPSQGGFGNRPKSYGNSISWSSPTSKIEPQLSPRQAFDQVFFGQTEAGRKAAKRRRRIVDAVWNQAKTLRTQVSRFDQVKLDQYLDSIADLEAKLDKAIRPHTKAWTPPNETDFKSQRPAAAGIPSSYPEHLDLMMDVMLLALQTDSTRVGTLVMGHSISRLIFDFVDPKLKRNHHDFSHHRNDPEKIAGYMRITEWFAKRTAALLEKMDAIDEGDGSLLDNSVVLFGSGMKDGNTHEPLNVPVALFGSGGGRLKTNRHLTCPQDTILAQLHLSLLQAFEIEAENFNGVTNKGLPELL
ncbi:MAG: DUF1552 domain-containing protein [Verrucomicrobiota bacterium]